MSARGKQAEGRRNEGHHCRTAGEFRTVHFNSEYCGAQVVAGNEIGVDAAKSIAEVIAKSKSLTKLDLSIVWSNGVGCNKLGDEGAGSIAGAIKSNSTLRKIDLGSIRPFTQ